MPSSTLYWGDLTYTLQGTNTNSDALYLHHTPHEWNGKSFLVLNRLGEMIGHYRERPKGFRINRNQNKTRNSEIGRDPMTEFIVTLTTQDGEVLERWTIGSDTDAEAQASDYSYPVSSMLIADINTEIKNWRVHLEKRGEAK